MKRQNLIAASCIGAIGVSAAIVSIAFAEPPKGKTPTPPAGMPEMKLPAGWSTEDMQACMEAGKPGKMHEWLAKGAGVWQGKNTMWMAPGMEPMKSECVSTITTMMDGRFTKCETTGDMPGMGPFSGFGVYGYDNVSKKFQCNWIDNCGTGMMQGTGELSADGKTLTWTMKAHCPIQKKEVTFREVEKRTSDNAMTLEMFGPDPKTGKEFKMMQIDFSKK